MLSSVRRGLVIAGVVAVFGAVLLALMPFTDSDVRCGSPLFGADAVQPDQPPNGMGLIVAMGCADQGAKRLVLASGLLLGGMLLTPVGLSLTRVPDFGPTPAKRPGRAI